MIDERTDKIIKTEYVKLKDICYGIALKKHIYWRHSTERTELIGHWPRKPWHNEYNGGFYGLIKVQWFIPKGCRKERIRVIGIEDNK